MGLEPFEATVDYGVDGGKLKVKNHWPDAFHPWLMQGWEHCHSWSSQATGLLRMLLHDYLLVTAIIVLLMGQLKECRTAMSNVRASSSR